MAAASSPRLGPARAGRGKRASRAQSDAAAKEVAQEISAGSAPSRPTKDKRPRASADDSEHLGSCPQVAKRVRTTANDDDSEAEALEALRSATAAAEDAAGSKVGVCDWRRGLQELRRSRPADAAAAAAAKGSRQSPDEVVSAVRQALKNKDFEPLLSAPPPRNADMAVAVRQLEIAEVVEALAAFGDMYERDPRREAACSLWILQVLEHHGDALSGRVEACATLRQLLDGLERRLSRGGSNTEALSCLGKWRFISELANIRRSQVATTAGAGADSDQDEEENNDAENEDNGANESDGS